MQNVDVLIVGAGPAGTSAALGLVPDCRVLMVDRLGEPSDRIGETLPAAARLMLTIIGADAVLDGNHHRPVHARRSVWGTPEPLELDGLRDPDGPGLRLDRRRFEQQLRVCALDSGVLLDAPARVLGVRREQDHWLVGLAGVRARTVRAAVIIDAGGRSSRLLRSWAGRRQQQDRLLCAWTSAPLLGPAASITYVESAPDGWWYTAPLPTGRRLLAFHTDADLGARAKLIDVLDAGPATSTLRASVADADLAAAGPVRVCAAGGGRPVDLAGDGWLTVGDASMSFDPLSSQGLFHALYTGQRSARAVLRMLDGKPAAGDYAAELEPVWAAYLANRAAYYGQERRWIDQPFWLRRAGDFSPHRGGRTPMTCHRPRPAGSA